MHGKLEIFDYSLRMTPAQRAAYLARWSNDVALTAQVAGVKLKVRRDGTVKGVWSCVADGQKLINWLNTLPGFITGGDFDETGQPEQAYLQVRQVGTRQYWSLVLTATGWLEYDGGDWDVNDTPKPVTWNATDPGAECPFW